MHGNSTERIQENVRVTMSAQFVCPVCELLMLGVPPEQGPVCPACGTEFEVDDLFQSHAQLRRAWIERGAPWFSPRQPAPPNWLELQQALVGSSQREREASRPQARQEDSR